VTGTASVGRENDRVHGRILRLAQFMTPAPHWILAMHFETIERGGVTQRLSLKSLDPFKGPSPFPELPADVGVFAFAGSGNVVLDPKFQSAWEIR
jgi:hypothetical protein